MDFLFVRQVGGAHLRERPARAALGAHQHGFPAVEVHARLAPWTKVLGLPGVAFGVGIDVCIEGRFGGGVHLLLHVAQVPLEDIVLVGLVRDGHERRQGASHPRCRGGVGVHGGGGRVFLDERHGVEQVLHLLVFDRLDLACQVGCHSGVRRPLLACFQLFQVPAELLDAGREPALQRARHDVVV